MVATSPQAASVVNRQTETVIGSGLRLKPEPRAAILGLDPEAAEEWAANVYDRFDSWAESQQSTVNERMNFYQLQSLMQLSLSRDGECFCLHNYDGDKSLQNPLRLGIIDPGQIREDGLTFTGGLRLINPLEGIVHDDAGRETAYKIWNQDSKTGAVTMRTIPRIGRSGRTIMTHGVYKTEYAGQTRGFPPLGVVIHELEKLLDVSTATAQAIANQSSLWAIGVTTGDTRGPDPVGQRVYELGQASYELGATPAPAADAENVTEESKLPLVEYIAADKRDFIQPGMSWMGLEKGQDVKFPAPVTPNTSYNIFVDSMMSWICAVTGQSEETVLMKFNANYSASRATLILTWRIAMNLRYNLAKQHLDHIYTAWLSEEIAAGRISCPGWLDSRLKAAWSNCTWVGESQPNIDPTKEAQAAKMYRDLGATTGKEIAQQYNGSNFESNVAQLKKEMEKLNDAIPIANAADKTYVEEKEEPNSSAKRSEK
ncbi:hypothetical protein AGMMS49991_06750 [Spirochaetia bacterium]|nr:hypothetical protein AGMMS49991_06750 [Spirochaetia bacterium]